MAGPTSQYRWNAKVGRYLDARGRFVPAAAIRQELDAALEAAKRRMSSLAEQLRTGAITLDEWFVESGKIVKQVHLYSAAAAKGGWAQLTASDFGTIGAIVKEQYKFLARFAQQITDGLTLDGRFLRRADLYSQAGRATYHKTESGEMKKREKTEERSVLNPADHCADCIGESRRNWQPIGTLIPIGERECGAGCKCTMEYR